MKSKKFIEHLLRLRKQYGEFELQIEHFDSGLMCDTFDMFYLDKEDGKTKITILGYNKDRTRLRMLQEYDENEE